MKLHELLENISGIWKTRRKGAVYGLCVKCNEITPANADMCPCCGSLKIVKILVE